MMGRPHDKSFRVSKLATQIKDSVITSFGASRALALSAGINRISSNLHMVTCRAFYKWLHLSTNSGGIMHLAPKAHIPRPSIVSALPPASEKLAAVVFKNFMRRSYDRRMRGAVCRWMRSVHLTPSPNLIPAAELRDENTRLRRKSQLLDPGESKTLGMVRRRLVSLMSSSLRVSVRRSFDKWKSLARILSYQVEMQRQNFKVEIGMQHIRSEKGKISEIRQENSTLQNWLLCSIYFMKWKVEDMNQKLSDERDVRFRERETVHKRVQTLKQRLIHAQQVERDAVATAALRGLEFCDRMKALQVNFEMAVAPPKGNYTIVQSGNISPIKKIGDLR